VSEPGDLAALDAIRLGKVRRNIARRLRRICAAMLPAEFDAMVARMAEIQDRYEQGATPADRLGSVRRVGDE
jgi:hypothetical protein